MVRPTTRGWALLVVIAGTYLAARIIGTWELYLLSLAFLAALLVSWLLVLLSGRSLTATRRITPERPMAGDQVRLSFGVRNGSVLPGLQVTLPDAAGGFGAVRVQFESLPSRAERVAAVGPWPARRGVHRLPALQVEAEDPLGLVRYRRTAGEALDVTVYPRLADLPACALFADEGKRRERGRRSLPTLGAAEFRGIRPHHPGEPLSHVDWKSTARTGTLMLREMDDPTSGDVTVALDARASQVAGEPPETSFELAVETAGSIAAYALRAGRAVSLLLQDDAWRVTKLSPHGDGHQQLLERLARARTHDNSTLAPSLQQLLASRTPLPPTRVLTLVVLSLDDRLAASVTALRDRGLHVALIHVAGDSFVSAPARPKDQSLLLSLEAAGVRCLTIRRDDDLRAVLTLWPAERERVLVS